MFSRLRTLAKRTASTYTTKSVLKNGATGTTSSSASTRLIHSPPSSSHSSSLRWLLLVSSSLLAAECTRRAFSSSSGSGGGGDIAHAATDSAKQEPIVSNDKSSIWNPPPLTRYDEWYSNWDSLSSVPPHTDPATGRPVHVVRHLLFIRHGQYVLPKSAEDAKKDPVLTELGREQAQLTGKRLKEILPRVDVIHSSTMARAYETAVLIRESFPETPHETSELIREGVPCMHVPQHPTWKPTAEEEATEPVRIQAGFERLVKRWRQTQEGKQIHSEEEWRELTGGERSKKDEAVAVLTKSKNQRDDASAESKSPKSAPPSSSSGTISIVPPTSTSTSSSLRPIRIERYELIVCHGNVIRYSLLRALQLPPQAWLRLAIYNTGISHITVGSDGHVQLRSIGDTGHLKKEQITYH